MKISLRAAIAVPILIGTLIGVALALLAMRQSFDTIHADKISYVGDDITVDLHNNFNKYEKNIYINLKRFADQREFREAVIERNKSLALESFISLSDHILPIKPSMAYVNIGNEVSWLNSADVFKQKYDNKVIKLIEDNAVSQSGILIATDIPDSGSVFLVFSVDIPAPNGFKKAGEIRAAYEFGPGSKFLDKIRSESDIECLMLLLGEFKTPWSGSLECDDILNKSFKDFSKEDLPLRVLVDDMLVAANKRVTLMYPSLTFLGARTSTIREDQKNQTYRTLLFVAVSVLITVLIAMLVSSVFVRSSMNKLLDFIGQDIGEHTDNHQEFSIKEFQKISDTHAESQAELIKLNDRLLGINREQSELTYAISHDIKSPIITILMLLSELDENYDKSLDENGKEIIDDMKGTAERMIDLINSILSYARSIGEAVEFSEVDLSELVGNIVSDNQGDIVRVDAEVRVGHLPKIQGNAIHLRMLFQNLLSNGLKYRDTKRRCKIDITSEIVETSFGNKVILRVTDNGIGIASEFQERVFGLFKRLHTYNAYQGSGIGLAICQRVAESHNGYIKLTSEEGKGTTFIVVLPLKDYGNRKN
jgi:signal transduction histidine kinase